MALGIIIRKGEYVLKREVEEALLMDHEEFVSEMNEVNYVKGSSFEDLVD